MEKKREHQETINVVVDLDPSLTRFAAPKGKETQAFRRHLIQYLNYLLEDLTIPASISLTTTQGETKHVSKMTSYQVTINGNRCRLPIPSIMSHDVQAQELARSVTKGVYRNPELFLPVSIAKTIREQWSSESGGEYLTGVSPDEFHEFLLEFVRRYFKIDRAKRIPSLLRDKGFPAGGKIWNSRGGFEGCVSDWSALTLSVLLPQYSPLDSNSKIMTQPAIDKTKIENMFGMMSDGLYYELGVMVPKVAIGIDERLNEGEFRIRLNDLWFPPIRGLRQGQFLVNDTVDRLLLIKVSGKPAINPANDSECAVIRDENHTLNICEKAGLTTWDPEGFIVLALSAEFRRNADAFISTTTVKHSTDQLEIAFPALVNTALKHVSISELTGILRALLEEEIMIRDLRRILEVLISTHTSLHSEHAPIDQNLGERLVDNLRRSWEPQLDDNKYIESLRIAFKRYIQKKYAKEGKTLTVFLLDSAIEKRILDADMQTFKPGDEDHDRLIKAIFYELGDVPSASRNAVILTTLEIRKKLRNMIKKEFPQLAVLCYQELDADLNIQPITRIFINERNSGDSQ